MLKFVIHKFVMHKFVMHKFMTNIAQSLMASKFQRFVWAGMIGLALVGAFAPWSWWFLQMMLLPIWLWIIRQARSRREAFGLAWLTGSAHYLLGLFWLTHSMTLFGGMPLIVATVLIAFGAAVLALLHGAFGYLFFRFNVKTDTTKADVKEAFYTKNAFSLVLLAVLWGGGEWFRGTILTGFPWLSLGYAHAESSLSGYAPFVGVYAISALVMALALLIEVAWTRRHNRVPRWWMPLLAVPIIFGGGAALQQVRFTKDSQQALTVSLVQVQIAQKNKFSRDLTQQHLEHYRKLIHQSRGQLIVMPETILPLLFTEVPKEWWDGIALENRTLAMGSFARDVDQDSMSNSVLAWRENGVVFRYDKSHLVPFGEFVPSGMQWLVDAMQIPLGSLLRGADIQLALVVDGLSIAFNICYESIFGAELARSATNNQADILMNVSNLAWFGEGSALTQFAQMSQMRALELQKPFLMSTNSGITAMFDASGKTIAALPQGQAGILEVAVKGARGVTPYGRYGDTLFGVIFFALVGLQCLLLWRRRTSRKAHSLTP